MKPTRRPKPKVHDTYMSWQARADGGWTAHWKPSPRLRRLGWTNLELGDDSDTVAALTACVARNKLVDGTIGAIVIAAPAGDRIETFGQLARKFQTSAGFTDLAPSTQKNYRSYLRMLETWAQDGKLLLSQLNRQMVLDFVEILETDSRRTRTKQLLAVLGVLMQYAEDKGYITAHPARNLRVASPKPRDRRLLRDELPLLVETGRTLGHRHVAIGAVLGFYTMQREGDLLAVTSFTMRGIDDISGDARRALSDERGHVVGLFLEQEKTRTPVGIPLAPIAREAVRDAISAPRQGRVGGTHIIADPQTGLECPEWRFQRDFRAVVVHLVKDLRWRAHSATLRQEHSEADRLNRLADRYDGIQFRDLRRSGMCWMRDLGASIPMIAAISGHSIAETTKILDTYMPRDIRIAAEGMALAVTRQAERDAADAQEGQG
jgi:hypothetical protein